MAPEQLAGKGASVRSDVYALGLVLYELSTGKKAFDAASLDELQPQARGGSADGAVGGRAGLRPGGRARDPALPREGSGAAAVVGGAGRGGAAGRRSSRGRARRRRDAVARNGRRRGRAGRPLAGRRPGCLLLALAAALALAIVFMPRAKIGAFVSVDKPPDALRERARDILQSVEVGKPADSASWFRTDRSFLEWARAHGGLGGDLSRDAVAFVYRQSPSPLVPWLATTGPFPTPMVTSVESGPRRAGDGRGLGRSARKAGPARDRSARAFRTRPRPRPTDWSPLFREAGLDIGRFTPVAPRWSPRGYATERAAWEGPHPERPGVTMRVEAASYAGRPVSFRWLGPWTEPERPASAAASTSGELVFECILFLCILGGAILVRRNLRSGRSDRRGALRLAAAIGGSHAPDVGARRPSRPELPTRAGSSSRRSATPPERGSSTGSSTSRSSRSRAAAGPRC